MSSNIKVVAFDVDGTLIEEGMVPRLVNLFEFSREEDLKYLKQYQEGTLMFRDWFTILSDAWATKTKTKSEIEAVCHDYTLMLGARETIEALRKKYIIAIISSGIDLYVDAVAKELSINWTSVFNEFEFDDQNRFKRIRFTSPSHEFEHKVEALKTLEKEHSVQPAEIVYVGDSQNDLAAFEYTERGVLIGAGNTKLQNKAWKQINTLPELLHFL